jgi:hypothetical protein
MQYYPLKKEFERIPRPDHTGEGQGGHLLGRITMQKGLRVFVEAANMVLNSHQQYPFLYGWLRRYDGRHEPVWLPSAASLTGSTSQASCVTATGI